MGPGSLVKDPISAISLGLALMFGTAGLPHILMRFFTVSDAKAARKSVFYATGFIGYFYILTFIIGFGAITLLMQDPTYFKAGAKAAANGSFSPADMLGANNMSAVHLSKAVGGSLFLRLHLGRRLRDHPGGGVRPDAGGRFGRQPRPLRLRDRQGTRHGRQGSPPSPRSRPSSSASSPSSSATSSRRSTWPSWWVWPSPWRQAATSPCCS